MELGFFLGHRLAEVCQEAQFNRQRAFHVREHWTAVELNEAPSNRSQSATNRPPPGTWSRVVFRRNRLDRGLRVHLQKRAEARSELATSFAH